MSKQKKIAKSIQTKNNNKKNKADTTVGSGNEVKNLIIILGIIAAVFLIFYIITKFVLDKENDNVGEEKTAPETIQYEEIVISNLLNQNPDKYYVLVYDDSDDYFPLYQTIIEEYQKNEKPMSIYFADLKNVLSKKYLSDENNVTIDEISNLKLKETAFFEINKGKIIKASLGKDQIIKALGNL